MKLKLVYRDISIVMLLTIIAVILALIVPANWIPIRILTLPLVFVLPGYALTSAIFPGRSPALVERLVFSLGFSLAIVIVSGLVLNLTSFGLRTSSWAVFLCIITLGLSAIAHLRQRGQDKVSLISPNVRAHGLTARQGMLPGLAVLIVCGAVIFSIIGAETQPRPGFTQLWILPDQGASRAENVVRLGMSNMEAKDMTYRLVVDVNGKAVKVWTSIHLAPNQNWQETVELPAIGNTGSTEVEALLYRVDAPTTLYHHVVLWLNS